MIRITFAAAGVAALCAASPVLAADLYPDQTLLASGREAGPALTPLTGAGVSDFAASEPDSYAAGGIFDEVRLGGEVAWQDNDEGTEDGGFVTGQVLFDPLWGSFGNPWLDAFLRPRPYLGASVSVADGTDQLLGGVSWTFPLFSPFFLEASFGGSLNDGDLHTPDDEDGVALGCHLLFHEGVGLGVKFGEHWRVIGSWNHSSHANICGDDNNGLTRLGGSVGYRF